MLFHILKSSRRKLAFELNVTLFSRAKNSFENQMISERSMESIWWKWTIPEISKKFMRWWDVMSLSFAVKCQRETPHHSDGGNSIENHSKITKIVLLPNSPKHCFGIDLAIWNRKWAHFLLQRKYHELSNGKTIITERVSEREGVHFNFQNLRNHVTE